jgi:hypothetical protein
MCHNFIMVVAMFFIWTHLSCSMHGTRCSEETSYIWKYWTVSYVYEAAHIVSLLMFGVILQYCVLFYLGICSLSFVDKQNLEGALNLAKHCMILAMVKEK